MRLLVLAGLAQHPTREQVGDAGMAALVLAAEQALRAGVAFTVADWLDCCDYEREALAQAGNRLAADRAVLTGAASQGLEQAALAAAHRDGGRALEAVRDATELAANAAAAERAVQRQLGESSLTRVPSRVVSIDQVDLPREARP